MIKTSLTADYSKAEREVFHIEIERERTDKEVMKMKKPDIEDVQILDGFWKEKLDQWSTITINHVFDQFERVGALKNFKNTLSGGNPVSDSTQPWTDGLLYETIRAASDFMRAKHNAGLEARIDGYIDIIYETSFKDKNGYLSTHNQMANPGKYFDDTNEARWYHDAYNFGCMTEAAVHYYKATGKTKLLFVATRFAEFIVDNYGYGKINMVPSHEGPEEMLLKLYELYRDSPSLRAEMETYDSNYPLKIDENQYAELVKFWIENRGNYENRVNNASYNVYAQDHELYFNQTKGAGHAVRANLFYTGMAAAGHEFDNHGYLSAAEKIFDNIVNKQMYLTGGVGAAERDEAYEEDYVLPLDGYCETCAQVAMGFFSQNMSRTFNDSKYADLIEKYIYNGVLGCIGQDGKTFYYQQPLTLTNARWEWLDNTPCCPPMFLKFYSELASIIYSYDGNSVNVDQFISGTAALKNGVTLTQTSDMPYGGNSKITVDKGKAVLRIRMPGWADIDKIVMMKNNSQIKTETVNGYAVVSAEEGDVIEVAFPIEAKREYMNSQVQATSGLTAISAGPLIYSIESIDNAIMGFNKNETSIALPKNAKLVLETNADIPSLGKINIVTFDGGYKSGDTYKHAKITAVPYYLRANRGSAKSYVFIGETDSNI